MTAPTYTEMCRRVVAGSRVSAAEKQAQLWRLGRAADRVARFGVKREART